MATAPASTRCSDDSLPVASRAAVFALACVLALDAADKTALGALAPALKTAFHVGNGEIGLLASAFSIVGGLATIRGARCSSRWVRWGCCSRSGSAGSLNHLEAQKAARTVATCSPTSRRSCMT